LLGILPCIPNVGNLVKKFEVLIEALNEQAKLTVERANRLIEMRKRSQERGKISQWKKERAEGLHDPVFPEKER